MVGLIMDEHPSDLARRYYKKLKKLLDEKEIPYFDSVDYFRLQKEAYKGQSFYYINTTNPSGHLSQIGNGVYASGLKKELIEAGIVNDTVDYYFANFNLNSPMLLIDKHFDENIIAVIPYVLRDMN